MSDKYADHDSAWEKDMEIEAANEIRPEGGEQKRPATASGGRPSGPTDLRQEQDWATNAPAPGLPAPDAADATLREELTKPQSWCGTNDCGVCDVCKQTAEVERLQGEVDRLKEAWAATNEVLKADNNRLREEVASATIACNVAVTQAERLLAALVAASEALDAAGCQVAASDAHQAVLAASPGEQG